MKTHNTVILVCLNKNRTGFPRRASFSGETQNSGSCGCCCAVGEASGEIVFYLTDISGFCSFLNERKAHIKLSCSLFPCVKVRIPQKRTECMKWNNYSVDGVCVCVVILGLHWLDKGRCPCAKDHQ